ncbi:HNH endonuclease [Latilactobacillus curvatus]|uniref:HNH endonuclease n=1 Tax=Latilactobacillus curvatus TaxID=28038 RepID=UPI00240ED73C|nr:HNH endonuclease [Latilactobacillus curvatus]MDG2980898.1 HNH endonuclease [Latilactobacillus curvatus]WEU69525.1 homing endonuclease [Latilactobacillus phage TMW 1.1365 P2]
MLDTSTREARTHFYNSQSWRELRADALERDHYECLWCKADGKVTSNQSAVLEVDHIKELEFYPECALDIDNLRTLCKDCHNKRHHRFNYKSHGPKKENKWKDDERWD